MRSRLLCVLALIALLATPAVAQQAPIRLSVNHWRVDPGDNYTLTWMERSGVNAQDADYTLEEGTDPNFKDKQGVTRWPIHGAHHKAFENSASFSHVVRYYRVRANAWVRGMDGASQNAEEVVSNVVRVTLVGTNKAVAVPAFSDDPEIVSKRSKKSSSKDDPSKQDDRDKYPTAGRPDLYITKIVLSTKEPKANQPFGVRVQVRNGGVVPSQPTSVKVDCLGRSYELEVDALKPGFAVDVTLPTQTAEQAGPITIRAEVDPNDKITESREDNNVMSETFPIAPADPKPEAKEDTPKSSAK